MVHTKSSGMFGTLSLRTRPRQTPDSTEDHKLHTNSVILCSVLSGLCGVYRVSEDSIDIYGEL